MLYIDDVVLGLELCGMLVTGNYAWQRQLLHSPGHAGNTRFSGSWDIIFGKINQVRSLFTKQNCKYKLNRYRLNQIAHSKGDDVTASADTIGEFITKWSLKFISEWRVLLWEYIRIREWAYEAVGVWRSYNSSKRVDRVTDQQHYVCIFFSW